MEVDSRGEKRVVREEEIGGRQSSAKAGDGSDGFYCFPTHFQAKGD